MFEIFTGFPEGLADQVRHNLQLDETRLISLSNKRTRLHELRHSFLI